ncbi:protein phosphatase 2C domain-containing protein [Cyanobium sp. Cruz CV13-4-11]|uniref:protein phosphatase 2C domain-containing protein n=1 Tax=Cyanobium sp. Cruz CV13-4-11 TaxID=2823710 RepID=UPI0020CE4F94|nr:protein phosphatase 2C domain-containing protein [Cyanobium sp. Cruz CV13-4-11]MCP9900018.1 protein phosphatase 2C domain-containing protein [Cyanobium sp. Cruz CV11-17]MCP9919334.1 protein phosphatase 2C domain-containing protein [Cyanobium sp. Cruz CV13-4-11]
MVNRWAAPIAASRAGAAHLRAGRPCQDAVLYRELRDTDGQPVMLMAVADGHGGRRYRRSEVGSRLACETALAVASAALASAPPEDGEGAWSRWLAHDLPEAVQGRWLEAVQAHWQSDPGEGGFEPLLYGSTLGLVVMTARWWGHTGLGDWDLVRVEADGRARLLEEENEPTVLGEATCSLCQPQAASLFARRAALYPLALEEGDFALVLCTDGIRKSCATDGDFLTLAAWLARSGGEGVGLLPEALDRISREGSGDDVTVAIGRAGALGEAQATQTTALAPSPPPAAQASPPRRQRPAIGRALAIGLALAAAGAGLLALVWPRTQPQPQAAPTSPGLRAALAEVERLCGQPVTIPLELRRRRDLFVALRQGRQDPGQLKAAAATDPLAALIAADLPADQRSNAPAPASKPAAAQARRPLQALGACPALREALSRQWALTPAATTP